MPLLPILLLLLLFLEYDSLRTRNAFYASFRRINHLLFHVFSSLNRLVATNSYHFLPVATCNRDPWQPVFRKRCNEQRVTLARQPPLCVYPPRRSPNFHNKPIVPSKPTARPSSKRSLARRRDFAFKRRTKLSPSSNSFPTELASPRFSGDRRADGNHNIFA